MSGSPKTGKYQPNFQSLNFSTKEAKLISPFFTNLDRPVFSIPFLPPEVIGALCSRASRAKGDLREIFLHEFLVPFLEGNDEYSKSLKALVNFLRKYPLELIFSNPKGRDFYVKWLAQYGDDSIAQMSGSHLIFSDLSFLAIKHFERMRVGLSPIEKSTRYVDYSQKSGGRYRYYTDPDLKKLGLLKEYEQAMDFVFDTYKELVDDYFEILSKQYPDESAGVLRAKAFDTVRGLLPIATLSQVAFFGNGQAFEYAISRCLQHELGEIRWAGETGWRELERVIPAFLRRLDSQASKDYQAYLTQQGSKIKPVASKFKLLGNPKEAKVSVELLSYDRDGEDKVIASLVYPQTHQPYNKLLAQVKKLTIKEKSQLLETALKDRTQRFYKVPRAFEDAYMNFEITANWAVWKDLQRHRMLTTHNQLFNVHLGYDLPNELVEVGLDGKFKAAIEKLEAVYHKIELHSPQMAQYATTQAHRMRFTQQQNLRSLFWTTELRTIAQGHPDYRFIEQEKAKIIKEKYPLIGKYLLADMNQYVFARRDSEKAIKKKTSELSTYFKKKK